MHDKQAQRLRDAVTLAANDDNTERVEFRRWRQADWGGVYGEVLKQHEGEIEHLDLGDGIDRYAVPVTCGTHGCIAGHIAMSAGDKLLLDRIDMAAALDQGERVTVSQVVDKEGDVHYISERASELLGLGTDETYFLFNADNDIHRVVEFANTLLVSHGHKPIEHDDLDTWED